MAKGMDVNILHTDGPQALLEINGKLYWSDVSFKTLTIAVLPTEVPTASISLIGGQSKPVSV